MDSSDDLRRLERVSNFQIELSPRDVSVDSTQSDGALTKAGTSVGISDSPRTSIGTTGLVILNT